MPQSNRRASPGRRVETSRRLDSRRIVADAVEFVDVPPTRYFQLRLLNRLRAELIAADPHRATVTGVTTTLGVTQLGRIAGRYRSVFGETPSATLRHHHQLWTSLSGLQGALGSFVGLRLDPASAAQTELVQQSQQTVLGRNQQLDAAINQALYLQL